MQFKKFDWSKIWGLKPIEQYSNKDYFKANRKMFSKKGERSKVYCFMIQNIIIMDLL